MKVMIAVPCLDMVHTGFCRSLVNLKKPPGETIFAQSSLVYDSRNLLSEIAIEKGFDRVLWLDSDMTFEPDFYEKLAKHLDEGIEFVSGIYKTRKLPSKMVVYETVEPTGAISLKPVVGFGEDLSFCYRVTMLGKKMYCDGSVRMGHIGQKIYEV